MDVMGVDDMSSQVAVAKEQLLEHLENLTVHYMQVAVEEHQEIAYVIVILLEEQEGVEEETLWETEQLAGYMQLAETPILVVGEVEQL